MNNSDPMMDLPKLQIQLTPGHALRCDFHVDPLPRAKLTVDAVQPKPAVSHRKTETWRDQRKPQPVMRILPSAYADLMGHLGGLFVHEKAGILIGPEREPDLITQYLPDTSGQGSASSFQLDHVALNEHLRRVKTCELTCVGLCHVHPPGVTFPSDGDLAYLQRLFANPKNDSPFVLFPIVAQDRLHPFLVEPRDGCRVISAQLQML